jgi:hypothetical protein
MYKLLLTLLLFGCTALAQTDSLPRKKLVILEPQPRKTSGLNPWDGLNGYRFSMGYLKDFEAEASYLISSYPKTEQGFGGMMMLVHYLGAGVEYVKDGPTHAIGAKLSYEASFFLFSGQLGADYLVADGMQQARIMPKIGLSLFGMVTLYYGRNFNLLENSRLQPHGHVLSLQVNFLMQ